MIQDYSEGPQCGGALECGEGRQVSQSPRSVVSERLSLLALKGEGITSQGAWWPLEAGKDKGTDCPLEVPERSQPCHSFSRAPFGTSGLQDSKTMHFLSATEAVICFWSGDRERAHQVKPFLGTRLWEEVSGPCVQGWKATTGSEGSMSLQVLEASCLWTSMARCRLRLAQTEKLPARTSHLMEQLLQGLESGHRGGSSLGPGSRSAHLDKREQQLGDKGRDEGWGGGKQGRTGS